MQMEARSYALVVKENPSIIEQQLYELVYHDKPSELDKYLQAGSHTSDIFTVMNRLNNEYFSLLMLASLHGYEAVVRVLLSHCPSSINQIELKGCVYSINGDLVDNVTALWCALDRAYFPVAHILIDLGKANVQNGPCYPLLIDAIMRGRFDIVRFLVDNEYAYVNGTMSNDENKCSSLIVSTAKDNTQIMTYLIEKGADLDYRTCIQNNTALGVAAIEGHIASVRLLCLAGASSTIKNRHGMTPLILAAKNDQRDIVDFLLEHNHDETTFNDLELFASSYMISDSDNERHEPERMVRFLRQSIEKRILLNMPKNAAQPIAAYSFQKECQSIDEFDQIRYDNNRLYIEALLIRERILKPRKDESLFKPLREQVIVLVQRNEFDRSLQLALHTFYLYQQMKLGTVLHRFVWIFCRMLNAHVPIPADLFLKTCHLVFEPSQQELTERNLNNALFLIIIATKIFEQTTNSNTDRHAIIQWIQKLCRQQRTTPNGQTLLHLSVDPQTNTNLNYRSADTTPLLVFPNLAATKLLLTFGKRWLDLNATNKIQHDTALHLISRSRKRNTNTNPTEIVELLINAGAHIDCVNANGETPLLAATENDIQNLLRYKQTPPLLKCLCARFINKQQMAYERVWPTETPLNTFVLLHGGLRREPEPLKHNSKLDVHAFDSYHNGFLDFLFNELEFLIQVSL